MTMKTILTMLWIIPTVTGRLPNGVDSEYDLSTRPANVPPLLYLKNGYSDDYNDLFRLTNTPSEDVRPEYQSVDDGGEERILYKDSKWTWIDLYGDSHTNPAQTFLPPVSGWSDHDYDYELSFPRGYESSLPLSITILPTTMHYPQEHTVSGKYRVMAERHHGFPAYEGQEGFLYVRKIKFDHWGTGYVWVHGSKISDTEELFIYLSFSSLRYDLLPGLEQAYTPPAISPGNWTDWTNNGTRDEPILKPKFSSCRSKKNPSSWIILQKEDKRICNGLIDCENEEDEQKCSFIKAEFYTSLSISGVILLIGILVFRGLHYFEFVTIPEPNLECGRKVDKKSVIVDDLTRNIHQDEKWEESESSKKSYRELHQMPGGILLLMHTVVSLLDNPSTLHKVATFAREVEMELHDDCKDNSHAVEICWRSKIGSNNTAAKIFKFIDKPGSVGMAMYNVGQSWIGHFMSFIGILSLVPIFMFILDFTKDVLLWTFLFYRIDSINAFKEINGEFVVLLVWTNLFCIFFAQSMMGTYIILRGEGIFMLPEGLMKKVATRCVLFLLTPIVPCLVILKVSTITVKKKELVEKWRNSRPESASTVSTAHDDEIQVSMKTDSSLKMLESASTVAIAYDDEIQFSMKTNSSLKMLEATLESFPQIVLLLAYFLVSVKHSDVLPISGDGKYSSLTFGVNILISTCTLVMSIINSINVSKGEQLTLKQKLVLALSYIFQICARAIPIFQVIYMTIINPNEHITIYAVLMILLPIIFHWFAQYVVCYLTAPGFKDLESFDQILHVLINTFVVIPLRPSPGPGHQVHKSRQIFWSFFLFTFEVLVILILPFKLIPIYHHAVIMVPVCLLPLVLVLSPLTLVLFYRCCHTWKGVNKERKRSWTWCCGGSLGQEIAEEDDGQSVGALQS